MRASSFVFVLLSVAACGGGVATPDGTGTPFLDPSGTGGTGGSGSGSGNKTGSGSSAPSAPSDGSHCHYEEIKNPPGCPAKYRYYDLGRCDTPGLECWYPGAGDGTSDGCWATALLACVADRETDGGADGGAGTGSWRASQ